jgi:YD repeat-containing protein
LPALPVTTIAYDIWDQPETTTETFGATTRTKKTTFDPAGRPVTSEITSTNDTPAPAVTNHYDEKTGALVKQSEIFEGVEKTLTTLYNKVGQAESYTDADGAVTTYKYDVDGRPTEVASYTSGMTLMGRQTYTYAATTGFMTKLLDSGAGTFTAAYDVAGEMTSETYPNNMTATYTRDAAGESTGIEYAKNAYCASACPEAWFAEAVVPSIHGEAIKRSGTLTEVPQAVYDAAGRLIEVREVPAGKGCTSRIYGYDEQSNRTSLTTRAPDGEGKCTTEGGSTEAHTYDSGDRLTDSGVAYETFGNTTKLPASDAGGAGMEITSSYYVDNQIASQEQGGKTTSYYMDPAERLREMRTAAGATVTHYAGPGAAVAWVGEPESRWTRDVPGIDGALAGTQSNAGIVTLILHDLQGNAVATVPVGEKETKLQTTYNSTEFGVPTNGAPPKYGWLGASGITSESPSGAVVQDGIAYVPQTGQALQTQGLRLPNPENAAAPFAIILSSWVVEGTAAVAEQLTNAEEAQRELEESEEDLEELLSAPDPDKGPYFYSQGDARRLGEKLNALKDWSEIVDGVEGLLGLADPPAWLVGAVVSLVVLGEAQHWLHNTGGKLEQCGKNEEGWVAMCRLEYGTKSILGAEFVDFTHTSDVRKCGVYYWHDKTIFRWLHSAFECRRLKQAPKAIPGY